VLENLNIPLNENTYSEQVFHHVKRLILSETLKPGQRIPEEKIAQSFGVSRTPIREALRKLEKYGLVTIVPRSHAEVVSLDRESAYGLWDVRILLEAYAIARLARTATQEDVDALTDVAHRCDDAAEADDMASTFEIDNEFHLQIAQRCGNSHVFDLLNTMSAKIQLHRTTFCTDIAQVRQDIKKHYPIIEAVKRHDSEQAESLLTAHIRQGEHQEA
jgi:DNA-binding GntR family transcriptional regulator